MALLALGDKHTFIEAFHVLLDGKAYNIPEPDPVLIHFDRANFLLKQITTTRARLIEKLGTGLRSGLGYHQARSISILTTASSMISVFGTVH